MLGFYLLWLLRQRLSKLRPNEDNVENRHWPAIELCQLFEGCGVTEDLVMSSLNRIYDRRLIQEVLDPNVEHVGVAIKIAIKESGLAHLELVLNSTVYIEQMALVTGLNELSARDEIKRNLQQGSFGDIRDAFLRYVSKIDNGRLGVPPNELYSQIRSARSYVWNLVQHPKKRRAGIKA